MCDVGWICFCFFFFSCFWVEICWNSVDVGLIASATTTQDPLQSALQKLRTSNAPSVYTTAVTTLEKVLTNIVNNPMEEKYRQVKKANAAFQKRLGGLVGGDDAMKAAGFVVEVVDGAEVYKLNASEDAWVKLMESKAAVATAVQEAKRATMAPPAPVASGMGGLPNMGAMPGMGGMPGMGAMPGMGGIPNMPGGMPNMNDPRMQNAAWDMMSNPEALRNMLQVR